MWQSWHETMAAYRRERYPLTLFAPLSLLVTATGLSVTDRTAPADGALLLLATGLALLSLRVLDDLADRRVDRRKAPERITVRHPDPRPFAYLAALAGIGALSLLGAAQGAAGAMVAGALALALGSWYVVRDRVPSGPSFNAFAVMAKYPLIAAAVAGTALSTAPQLAALVALYGAALAFEFLHDPATAPSRSLSWPVGAAVLALAAMAFSAEPTPVLVGGLLVCATLFVALHQKWPAALPMHLAVMAWTPAVFVATARWLN